MTHSVADLCERYGVDEHTVLGWIRSGELRAINVGRTPAGKRPRWRVTAEALAAFELARESGCNPTPQPKRRRKAESEVIKFY
jgi:transposase